MSNSDLLSIQDGVKPWCNLNINSINLLGNNPIIMSNNAALKYSNGAGTQSIASSVATRVSALPTQDFQQGDVTYNPATGDLTFASNGIYNISFSIEYGLSAVNTSYAQIYLVDVVSTKRYLAAQVDASDSHSVVCNASANIKISAPLTLTLLAFQTSGSPQNIGANFGLLNSPNHISVVKLSSF